MVVRENVAVGRDDEAAAAAYLRNCLRCRPHALEEVIEPSCQRTHIERGRPLHFDAYHRGRDGLGNGDERLRQRRRLPHCLTRRRVTQARTPGQLRTQREARNGAAQQQQPDQGEPEESLSRR
jgi:methylphosphotriester-DNA--protein-cysteine methyltransferase